MLWKYTSQPAAEPVTYAQAKAQVGADDDTEQAGITAFIVAARTYGEKATGKTWIQRNAQAQFYDQCNRYDLPRGPVQSITSIIDGNGLTVSTSTYSLRRVGDVDYVYFTNSPPSNGNGGVITINYVAGYGDYTTVPADLVTAVLLHVGQLYNNREAGTDKPQSDIAHGLDCIYQQHRSTELAG